MQSELKALFLEYSNVLENLCFDESVHDRSVIEKHRPMLEKLSQTGNVGITVFDLHLQEHVFTSYNFTSLFGYELEGIAEHGNEYFNARIHPEDFIALTRTGINVMKFYLECNPEERLQIKLINEYRILNSEGKYIRVIEQHQILDQDAAGNAWLTLGVIDLSPNQDITSGVRSQLLNFRTGKILPFPVYGEPDLLTPREKEVLGLVKDGYLSKEISETLSISIHTVNTHRQRILEKLGADNSMEAVARASRLGLLD